MTILVKIATQCFYINPVFDQILSGPVTVKNSNKSKNTFLKDEYIEHTWTPGQSLWVFVIRG